MGLYYDHNDYMEYIQFLYETDENQITDCSTSTETVIDDIEYQMTGEEGVYSFTNPTAIDEICEYTLDLEYLNDGSWIGDTDAFFPSWATYD
jgi:hypothetical protein